MLLCTCVCVYVLLSGKASFCIHGVISSPAVNPLGPTEIDCEIYLYGAVSQMTWQMLVLGTGEEQPKTKKNRGKLSKKPRPTWGS
jgi:hypothetical protein